MRKRPETVKKVRGSGNIYADLGFPKADAEHMKLRADLMIQVIKYVRSHKLTQTEAARLMGVRQPRISEIFNGRIDLFTIDQLVGMLARIGVRVSLTTRKAA